MTYEEAARNQWHIAYHRMVYAREHEGRQCKCADCQEHLKAIAEGPKQGDL